MRELTEYEIAMLKMYTDATYSIQFSKDEAEGLQALGLLTRVPGTFGGIAYAITDEGKRVRDEC